MNYFSSRLEEIKDGSFVPTYETLKELPQFSEINRETFRIARKQWYRQHFRMTFIKYSKLSGNLNTKSIPGGGPLIGLKYPEKELTISEKASRKTLGIVLSIVGLVLIIVDFIWVPLTLSNWLNPTFALLIFAGIVMLLQGINLIRKYSKTKIVPEN